MYHIDHERLVAETAGDGVFPLITNDHLLSGLEMLLAYKGQPALEKRFSHLKTDFEVAPVYLKEVSRIQALLCVYFLMLLNRLARSWDVWLKERLQALSGPFQKQL